MSVMFPTIFALGIHGLGEKSKLASSFIVMAIMGGALLPKLMGWVGDVRGMSDAFLVPMGCFVIVSIYGFLWPKLSGSKKTADVKLSAGH
jgi:FHS family L-fucose permease-like MFS transporter